MLYLVLLILSAKCVTSAPVNTIKEEEKEPVDTIAHYKEYLKEASRSLHLDPNTLATIKKLLDNNVSIHDFLFWNSSLRGVYDESKRRIMDELLGAGLKKRLLESDHPDGANNPEKTKRPSNMELVKKSIDRFKELDLFQIKQYEGHVEKEKNETVQRFLDLPEEKRSQLIEHYKKVLEKHQKRPKVHQPGSGYGQKIFQPRTLFSDVDLNGDDYLDVGEVEAILQPELDKAYDPNDPEFDPWEEKLDQTKMRRKFMDHYDKDGDYFVSRDEFVRGVTSDYARTDEPWKTAQDEEDTFETNEDEIRRLVSEAQLRRQVYITQQPVIQQPTPQPEIV
ncbi:unnamed protein product [Heterobilharzia americana]|nr:unnamed protein product [Heterobilharzia americana]